MYTVYLHFTVNAPHDRLWPLALAFRRSHLHVNNVVDTNQLLETYIKYNNYKSLVFIIVLYSIMTTW